MKVISLFDGISCAMIAFEKAHIDVETYDAWEIDNYAVKISNKNFPGIRHHGDISLFFPDGKTWDTDLLIGGSPCQDLSIANAKNRKGLLGERSGLFWEYVRILKEIKPKYFILENVARMSKEDEAIITKELGVAPILIDANLVSAQDRPRLFWTNIPNVTLPKDKNITLGDIIDAQKERKWIIPKNPIATKRGIRWDTSGKGLNSQQDRARRLDQKHFTIPTARTITKVSFVNDDGKVGILNWDEVETLQGLPKNYTDLGKENRVEKRGGVIGNGFNVDVVAHILSFIPR